MNTLATTIVLLFACGVGVAEAVSPFGPGIGRPDAGNAQGFPAARAPELRLGGAETFRPRMAQGGPVNANDCFVVGRVLNLIPIQSSSLNISPPQTLFRLHLLILEIQDVPGTVNPLVGQEGHVFEVYTKESLEPGLLGKDIKGVVRYRAAERGGMYWIYSVRARSAN